MQTSIQAIVDCFLEQKEGCTTQSPEKTAKELGKLIQAVETMNNIRNTANILCDFCENNACENCIVQQLVDDATREAIHAGWKEEG